MTSFIDVMRTTRAGHELVSFLLLPSRIEVATLSHESLPSLMEEHFLAADIGYLVFPQLNCQTPLVRLRWNSFKVHCKSFRSRHRVTIPHLLCQGLDSSFRLAAVAAVQLLSNGSPSPSTPAYPGHRVTFTRFVKLARCFLGFSRLRAS